MQEELDILKEDCFRKVQRKEKVTVYAFSLKNIAKCKKFAMKVFQNVY